MSRPEAELHLGVSYNASFPEEIVRDLLSEVSTEGLRLQSESRTDGPQAGLEWLAPTALILFITRSYFDAFFNEMGKEHYHILKKSLKALWAKCFGKNRRVNYQIVSTEGKVRSTIQYSLAFSIVTDMLPDYRVKFMLRDDISEEEYGEAIDAFFALLERLDAGTIDAEIRAQLKDTRVVGRMIPLTYTKGKFLVLDPLQSIKHKNE